jgi:multiple sugar transport system permease protein
MGYASSLAWILFVIVMLITALQFSQQKRWVNYDA